MNTLPILLFVTLVGSAIAQSYKDCQQVVSSENRFLEPFHHQLIKKTDRRRSDRITNGTIVTNAELFPYQVGFLAFDAKSKYRAGWCGASLISRKWILTAAHCLEGIEEIEIYLGTEDIRNGSTFTVGKSNFIIHKCFNYAKNDIALIKLPTRVKLSNSVNIISLDKDLTLNKWVNKDAIVSGWGAVSSDGPPQDILQYAEVKVLSNQDCNKYYEIIEPIHICQKVIDNKGVCRGDSGGPLAVTENGKRVLIGIASFIRYHKKPCENNIPRIFTRVAAYRSWICSKTKKEVC